MRRWWTGIAALALVLPLSQCASSDDAEEAAPDLALSMTQPLPFQGLPKVLLRVDNLGPEPLHITEAGLDWTGYGGRTLIPKDVDLQPGERIDLTYELAQEDCEAEGGEPEGVVVTDTGEVSQPLRIYGEEFIRSLWATRCFTARLDAAARISYAPGWRTEPSRLTGELLVRRKAGDAPIDVLGARGSVLYSVRLARPATLAADERETRVPVVVGPNGRCDEHAIGQATAPYTFKYDVRLGEERRLFVLAPPVELQDRIAQMLLEHCHREGGIRINR